MGICLVARFQIFFIKTREKQGLFVAARGATCLFFQLTFGSLKKQTGGAPRGHKQTLLCTCFDENKILNLANSAKFHEKQFHKLSLRNVILRVSIAH